MLSKLLKSSLTRRLLFESGISGYNELRKSVYMQETWKTDIDDTKLVLTILTSERDLERFTEGLFLLMISAVEVNDRIYFDDRDLLSVYCDLTLKPCVRYFYRKPKIVEYCARILDCREDIRSLPRVYSARYCSVTSISLRSSMNLDLQFPYALIDTLTNNVPATTSDFSIETIESFLRVSKTAFLVGSVFCSKDPDLTFHRLRLIFYFTFRRY